MDPVAAWVGAHVGLYLALLARAVFGRMVGA